MIAYHYSVTYGGDTSLKNDYHGKAATAEPYRIALENGKSVFSAMLLMGMYRDRLARAETPGGWFEYAKDATEAIFEFVRRREFAADSISRLNCVYYVGTLADAQRIGAEDWGEDGTFQVLEVELDEGRVRTYDQAHYDAAYERMVHFGGEADIDAALDAARRYFAGAHSEKPVMEILSDGENRVVRVC